MNRLRLMTIVLDNTEFSFCRMIESNLRLKQVLINGASVQTNNPLDILDGQAFKNIGKFTRKFGDVEYKNGQLLNFRLFIFMNDNNCGSELKQSFLSKDMFKDRRLYDYIVPIYSYPCLDEVLNSSGIDISGGLTLNTARRFRDNLKGNANSNFSDYLGYCIGIAESNLK